MMLLFLLIRREGGKNPIPLYSGHQRLTSETPLNDGLTLNAGFAAL